MSTKFTVAKLITQRIREINVDTVFVAPGPHTSTILREIASERSIGMVSCTDDSEAAYAAIGYSKSKMGVPGVFIVSDQSAFQVVSAIQSAHSQHIPLIVIVASASQGEQIRVNNQFGQGVKEGISSQWIHETFAQFTVNSQEIESAQMAGTQIETAFTAAVTMQQPVFIEIYENVFTQETQEPSNKIQAKNLVSQPSEQSNAIKHVVSFIKDAKQPVAWFGSDIARFGARADTIKWAQKVGINFFTSATSKAVIDEKNPLFAGVYAGKSSSKSVQDTIRQADAIIVFGETQTENDAFGQTVQEMFGQQNGSNKKIMFVNWNSVVEPNRFQAGPVYIRDFMNAMASSTEFSKVNTIKNVNPFVNTEKDSQNTQQGLTYDGIVHQIGQSGLMNNAITVVDGTIGLISTLTMQHNNQDTFISTIGTDSWGCAIATAVGASSGSRKRPIVFVGDGGFIAGSQSIQTVTKTRSNAVIVVFNNQLLGINQWTSNPRVYSGNTPVDQYNVVSKMNISKIGEAYDAMVFKVDSPNSLADAIRKSESSSDKVCIIDCQIPQKNYPMNCGWRIQNSQQ